MAEVAIYTRISQADPAEQTATGRQESACRAFAAAKEWQVVDVFEDVDRSAYSGAPRPAYSRMLEALGQGRVNGVLVWKLDRLVRRPSEFERFWAICERERATLTSVTEPIDSSTELGLALVRVLVTFASLESATKGIRTQAKLEELARGGEPPAHGRAVYGYTAGLGSVVPSEAAVIREAARRVIAGEGRTAIIRDWTARGILSPTGKVWSPSTLRRMLMNPYLVGDRAYRGSVVTSGYWPAILDRDTFEQLQAALNSRFRPAGPRAHYPLTGLLYCGRCGSRVTGHGRPAQYNGKRRYGCVGTRVGACGGVYCLADEPEAWVFEQLFAYLNSYELRLALHRRQLPTEGEAEELAAIRADLRRLAGDYYRDRALSVAGYESLRDALEVRLATAEGDWQTRAQLPALARLAGKGNQLRRRWPHMTPERRRAALTAAIERIVVSPIGKGRWKFDPARFAIKWRL